MAGNLSCLGFQGDDLEPMLRAALERGDVVGSAGADSIISYQDRSGARIVFDIRQGQLLDLVPSFDGVPGARVSGCILTAGAVARTDVVDQDGEQVTALAAQVEQHRALAHRPGYDGAANVVALGVDVAVLPDAAAFEQSPASLLDPDADPSEPAPAHVAERGLRWPPRIAAESFISYGVWGDAAESRAHARLAGTVLAAEQLTNVLTGRPFIHARVQTSGFEVDLCLDGNKHVAVPPRGSVIAGTVYLVLDLKQLPFSTNQPTPPPAEDGQIPAAHAAAGAAARQPASPPAGPAVRPSTRLSRVARTAAVIGLLLAVVGYFMLGSGRAHQRQYRDFEHCLRGGPTTAICVLQQHGSNAKTPADFKDNYERQLLLGWLGVAVGSALLVGGGAAFLAQRRRAKTTGDTAE